MSANTNWESHAKKLLNELEQSREIQDKQADALKRLVTTHETASEEVERLKREVYLRDQDIQFLWQEIKALNHGVRQLEAVRDYRMALHERQETILRNAHQKMEYLEHVIARQNALIERCEHHISLREEHLKALKATRAWKCMKAMPGVDFPIPLDMSTLPPLPEEVHEVEPTAVGEAPALPKVEVFERSFTKKDVLADGARSVLESPRSFVSPAVGQKVFFSGWCVGSDGQPPTSVWASLGGDRVPCGVGVLRQDVVHMNPVDGVELNPACGFHGEVSTGPGENFIEIHAAFSDGSELLLGKRIIANLGVERTPKRQLDEEYQSWIQCFDTRSLSDLEKIREHAKTLERQPLFSVLLPVYNTESRWLVQAIESVRRQIYTNWELCIADDASSIPEVREVLSEYQRKDKRIKVVYRERNGHIAAASNSALELATGDYCALLDHDDLLAEHALYAVALSLNKNPKLDLIFSDEDKVDSEGRRFDPYFKSDWNPDLFLSHNCISHLGVYRTSILKKIRGFREAFSGSQDWDLALRFLLETDSSRIEHIPQILYHWRYLEQSTSKTIASKPYAVDAGRRAIEDYLQARGKHALVGEGMWPGSYRVRYLLGQAPKVSVIIPTRDQGEVTERCIRSILDKTAYPDYEILLVDNQSTDVQSLASFEALEKEEKIQVLRYDHAFNFSAINNFAAAQASGSVLLFLNNDMEVIDSDWMQELTSQAMREEIGVAGAWLLYPDHTVQHAGILLGVCGIAVEAFKHQLEWNIGHMGRAHLNQNYLAVTGACLATRKQVFEEVGGFNEKELAVAYNDVDYCLRVRKEKGLLTTWTPFAKLIHHESVSRGYEVSEEKRERLERESDYMRLNWKNWLAQDPYYNVNLTRFDPRFGLAWPPRVLSPNEVGSHGS